MTVLLREPPPSQQPADLRGLAFDEFGNLAGALRNDAKNTLQQVQDLRAYWNRNGTLFPEWCRAIAEESLLAWQTAESEEKAEELRQALSAWVHLHPWLGTASPFDRVGDAGAVPLAQLLAVTDLKARVAVFPMDAKGGPLGHLWLVAGGEWGNRNLDLTGWDMWKRVHVRGEHQVGGFLLHDYALDNNPITGPSWQLAGALAHAALVRPYDGRELCRKLVKGWVVTGGLDGGQVTAVASGRKPERAKTLVGKKWMVPTADRLKTGTDAGDLEWPPDKRHVNTLDAAIREVLGGERREPDPQPWPDDVRIMHVLVGESLAPLLLGTLVAQPDRCVLWHTEKTEKAAQLLRDTLQRLHDVHRLRPGDPAQLEKLPSDMMEDPGGPMRRHSDLTPGQPPVLFNVTGGNHPMKLAAGFLARERPTIRQIYRDVDYAHEARFVQITHDSAGIATMTPLQPNPDVVNALKAKGIGIRNLFERMSRPHEDVDGWLRLLSAPTTPQQAVEAVATI